MNAVNFRKSSIPQSETNAGQNRKLPPSSGPEGVASQVYSKRKSWSKKWGERKIIPAPSCIPQVKIADPSCDLEDVYIRKETNHPPSMDSSSKSNLHGRSTDIRRPLSVRGIFLFSL